MKSKIKIGDRYGKLTVVEQVENPGMSKWRCVCDCGTEKVVFGTNLVNGRTKSCGCSKLYNKYVEMRHIGLVDVWKNYYVFKKWVTDNGYDDGCSFARMDESKPFGPDNCTVI